MIAPTTLAHAEVLTVSALTGAGVGALRAHLEEASVAAPDRKAGKRFRLAIDRVFTLSGVGVVATGTVLSGSVQLGDGSSSAHPVVSRVRFSCAEPPGRGGVSGDRCALNLTGPDITKMRSSAATWRSILTYTRQPIASTLAFVSCQLRKS